MATNQNQKAEQGPSARQIEDIFKLQYRVSRSGRLSNRKERLTKLRKLEAWVNLHAADIRKAIYQDFRKPEPETDLTEIYPVLTELRHTIRHLKGWMKPKRVKASWALTGTRSYVFYEPKGVCLIMAPWNYPFNLLLIPLISALAAGNRAILKPSEMTPHTSRLIRNMMEDLFDPEEVCVFEGDKDVAEALLKKPFDHIFFTGSPQVGKLVMKAAAENLTSVTLELGGKSPAIIDASANLRDAAEKIAWGKWLNNGQTCIAPDYLLVDERIEHELSEEIKKASQRLFEKEGKEISLSDDYARIVNRRHFDRLHSLLQEALEKGAELRMGGDHKADEHYLSPTLLANIPDEARIWQEEIFGPLLPVKTYTNLGEAVEYIQSRPKPLSLYLFTQSKPNKHFVLEQTTAGSVCINDTLLQYLQPNLPFGGVNTSGLGKAHGEWGFKAFSNEKSVVEQRVGLTSVKPVYPPYTKGVKKMISLMMKYL